MEIFYLPFEIQEYIYSKLPKKDLLSVSLVCAFCNKIALQILYRQILADRYPKAHRSELSFYQKFWNQNSYKREYGMLVELECNKNSTLPKYSYHIQKIEPAQVHKIEPARKIRKIETHVKKFFSIMENDQPSRQETNFLLNKKWKIVQWDEFGNIMLEKNKKNRKKNIIFDIFIILSILNEKKEKKLTAVDILNNELGCGFSDGQAAIIHFDLIKNSENKTQDVKFSEVINFKGHISSISTIKLDHEKCILFSKSIPKLWQYSNIIPIVNDLKIYMNFSDANEIPKVKWDGRILKARIGSNLHIWDFCPGIRKNSRT